MDPYREPATRLPDLCDNRGHVTQSVSPEVDAEEMVKMMNREGIELCRANMLTEAEDILFKAADIAKEIQSKERRLLLLSTTNNNIGYLLKLKGSLELAAKYVESALRIEYQLNRPSPSITLNLTAILNAKGMHNKARDLAKLTLDLLHEDESCDAAPEIWVAAWHNLAVAQLHATTRVLSADVVWNYFITGQKKAMKELGKHHPLTIAITESYKSAKASWLRTKLHKGKRRDLPPQQPAKGLRSSSHPRKRENNAAMRVAPQQQKRLQPAPPPRKKGPRAREGMVADGNEKHHHRQQQQQHHHHHHHHEQHHPVKINPTEALLEYSDIDPYSSLDGGWGADASEAWTSTPVRSKEPTAPKPPPPTKVTRNAMVGAKPKAIVPQRPKKVQSDQPDLVLLQRKIEHMDTQPLPPLRATPVAEHQQNIVAPKEPNVPVQAAPPQPVSLTGSDEDNVVGTNSKNEVTAISILEDVSRSQLDTYPDGGQLNALRLLQYASMDVNDSPNISFIDMLVDDPPSEKKSDRDSCCSEASSEASVMQQILMNCPEDDDDYRALRFLAECNSSKADHSNFEHSSEEQPHQLKSVTALLSAAMLDRNNYPGLAIFTDSISELNCSLQYSTLFKNTPSATTARLLDVPGHNLGAIHLVCVSSMFDADPELKS
eukprot:TRINITY_DN2440_c0_g1_i1.p1 TRINITY_DN2440_c0_g1~~TRINITY_DN2440_c0_g1_i1.p1  ORF type:complete len:660 (+),score=125.08 TRINITY_DN2440_c0_g1_i1:37-2016(+)